MVEPQRRRPRPGEDRRRAIEREKDRLEHELDLTHRDLEEGFDWPAPTDQDRSTDQGC